MTVDNLRKLEHQFLLDDHLDPAEAKKLVASTWDYVAFSKEERAELKVLEEFLPKQLSPEETEELVKAAIAEVGATSKKDMGAVMKAAQAKAAGRADGKVMSALVGKLLP